MSKIQTKWRESLTDINDIKFKNIEFEKIISYPPAGNDVFECVGKHKNEQINFIFKSERGKFANFSNEIKILEEIDKYISVPKVLDSGVYDDKAYIVLSKIEGEKLSDIFKENMDVDREKYLYLYGKFLAKIHKLDIEWEQAKLRNINDYPDVNLYKNLDEWEIKVIEYLKETKPQTITYDIFIHGDFHYGNILWDNYEIKGILDWEYSGLGFMEQDIAWALILRPGQKFMDNFKDISSFLNGYKSINKYDVQKLKWCYINGTMHFYLMNKNKGDLCYLEKLKQIINNSISS